MQVRSLYSIFETLYRHHVRNTFLLLFVSVASGLVELAGWGILTGPVQEQRGQLNYPYLILLVALLALRQIGTVTLAYLEIDITERFRQLIYTACSSSPEDKRSTYLVELRTYIAGCVTPGVKFVSETIISLAIIASCVLLLPAMFLLVLAVAVASLLGATRVAAFRLRPIGAARRREDASIADALEEARGTQEHSIAVSRYERAKKLTLLAPMVYAGAALLAALVYAYLARSDLVLEQTVISILLAMRGFHVLGNLAARYLKIQLNHDLAFKFRQI